MTSIDMDGTAYGRLAAEAVIRRAGGKHTRAQLLAAHEVFLKSVADQQQQEGGAPAAAFEAAARVAFDARLAELDALAQQSTRSDQ